MAPKIPVVETADRILIAGQPELERCNNVVTTSKYTLISFLPVAVLEQFRRVANMYFLVIGSIMAIGWYTDLYESAISPWTTLGPLAFVVSISLLQEGMADLGRHRSDSTTNNHPCVVLRRANELDEDGGERAKSVLEGKDVGVNLSKAYFLASSVATSESSDCKVAFEAVKRMNISQGHIVLIRNRDMVPADLILLASSADNGNAYIETSSIDGETNLKLRASPHLPKEVMDILSRSSDRNLKDEPESSGQPKAHRETLEQATKRICRISKLGFPDGKSALENPANPAETTEGDDEEAPTSGLHLMSKVGSVAKLGKGAIQKVADRMDSSRNFQTPPGAEHKYITAVKTEPPNASVNTFNGVMLLPAIELGSPSVEIPLNADNILLRGAVLRNTEWAIGLSCYTGKDTKLVQNSFETPSKFSRLDQIMNRTVLYILCIVGICIAYLATMAVITSDREFDNLWYVGLEKNTTVPWPYLPGLEPPKWQTKPQNWLQVYLLFITLLSNFVPLSLYVTIEVVTVFMRVLINLDANMYDEFTDTRTVARSTTVTDLGQVEYIFSDKTGTLTQNVMRFKRCSVDSLVFGAPIVKASPGAEDEGSSTPFHPISKLMVGKLPSFDNLLPLPGRASRQASGGLESLAGGGGSSKIAAAAAKSKVMTFNGEMFLRVMSLCHTVVVEKDFDAKGAIKSAKKLATKTSSSFGASIHKKLFPRSSSRHASNRSEESYTGGEEAARDEQAESKEPSDGKGKGGAPNGFAYQAESPDEGALVEASSLNFDYQVIGRDSSGIRLSVQSPSLLSDKDIIAGFQDGSLSEMDLAADTASPEGTMGSGATGGDDPHEEIWEVLAVNKFDSTRKRMSVLVRAPPEFGSIPMVLCKGADSAMLDATVLRNPTHAMIGDEDAAAITQRGCEPDESKAAEIDRANVLSLQSHLGEFAREGLRTLVLGVRILTEKECEEWLMEYTAAATSLKNRDEKLTAAAQTIESNIHVVGATAIEDKLQVGVPDTIALLGRAGIKLWVLTGDKRETAKEIGYATKVLTEKMRPGLIEVPSGSESEVQVKMAMAFLKLVKYAKLPDYQKSAISTDTANRLETFLFRFGKFTRRMSRAKRRFYHKRIKVIFQWCFSGVSKDDPALKLIDVEEEKEKGILQLTERHRNVRNRAEKIVRDYLGTPEGISQRQTRGKVDATGEIPEEDMNIQSSGPDVFDRADSARGALQDRRSKGEASEAEIRDLTMANLTAHEVVSVSDDEFGTLVDEDILSMKSFLPTEGEQNKKDFDKMKRTLLERLFAVDTSTRHGRLVKHLNKDKLTSIVEDGPAPADTSESVPMTGDVSLDGPRGLVIEGAALEKLLGDSELEELLFAVANTCDSVIACRVSPAQKAQLVQLVRRYVVPEPVTLAIGDGANDVGMIQEAHVGIGISGKEGQQAVNASDFAIAQFRFLQDLTLVHGRWNFMRLSTVTLFSFYKNALMAGVLIAYTSMSLYSGTPLFDEWLIAMLNFVAGFPILALGMFDRCLDREYVLNNPDTYTPTRRNELITKRILARWVILVFVHIFTIYYFTVPSMATDGGGATSAFVGLMGNDDPDRPGNGESGDIKSVGFVAFTTLIILLSLKVVFESKAIIIGRWPAFQLCKKDGEGWPNRLAYTWIANAWLSIGFYIASVFIYNALGRAGPSSFSQFVNTVNHVFGTSVRAWMLIIFVPTAAICFDVTGKLFSNLYYPTQTQIHVEIFTGKGKKINETHAQLHVEEESEAYVA
mmetsp:Transcript_30768/g.50812  ORF Transcript_30768/g.50812 Transcript_30768/m.50812 type:complete len:1752 (-) Transcript_30768:131-5386(-)